MTTPLKRAGAGLATLGRLGGVPRNLASLSYRARGPTVVTTASVVTERVSTLITLGELVTEPESRATIRCRAVTAATVVGRASLWRPIGGGAIPLGIGVGCGSGATATVPVTKAASALGGQGLRVARVAPGVAPCRAAGQG